MEIIRFEDIDGLQYEDGNKKELLTLLDRIKKKLRAYNSQITKDGTREPLFDESVKIGELPLNIACARRLAALLLSKFSQKSVVLDVLHLLLTKYYFDGAGGELLGTFYERLNPKSDNFYAVNDDERNEARLALLTIKNASLEELVYCIDILIGIVVACSFNTQNPVKEAGCEIAEELVGRGLIRGEAEKIICEALMTCITKSPNIAAIKIKSLKALTELIKGQEKYDGDIGEQLKDRILALAYDTNAPTKLELLKLMNVSLTEVMDRHLWGVILATPLLALLNDDLYEISSKAIETADSWGTQFVADEKRHSRPPQVLEFSPMIELGWKLATKQKENDELALELEKKKKDEGNKVGKEEQKQIQEKKEVVEKPSAPTKKLSVREQLIAGTYSKKGSQKSDQTNLSSQTSSSSSIQSQQQRKLPEQPPNVLPCILPYTKRPSVESRIAIRSQNETVFKVIKQQLVNADENVRDRGMGLLRMLIIHCEEHLTMKMFELMPLLHTQMLQLRSDRIHKNGEYCCALIGLFYSPAMYVPLLVRERPLQIFFDTLSPIIKYAPPERLLELDESGKETLDQNSQQQKGKFEDENLILEDIKDDEQEVDAWGSVKVKSKVEEIDADVNEEEQEEKKKQEKTEKSEENSSSSIIRHPGKGRRRQFRFLLKQLCGILDDIQTVQDDDLSNADSKSNQDEEEDDENDSGKRGRKNSYENKGPGIMNIKLTELRPRNPAQLSNEDTITFEQSFQLLEILVEKSIVALGTDELRIILELLLRMTAYEDLQYLSIIQRNAKTSGKSVRAAKAFLFDAKPNQSTSGGVSSVPSYPKRQAFQRFTDQIASTYGPEAVGSLFSQSVKDFRVKREKRSQLREDSQPLRFAQQLIRRSGEYLQFFVDELLRFLYEILDVDHIPVGIRHPFWESLFYLSASAKSLGYLAPYADMIFASHFPKTTIWHVGRKDAEIRFFSSSFFFYLMKLKLEGNPSEIYKDDDVDQNEENKDKQKESNEKQQNNTQPQTRLKQITWTHELNLDVFHGAEKEFIERMNSIMDDDDADGTRLSGVMIIQLILKGIKQGTVHGLQFNSDHYNQMLEGIFKSFDDKPIIRHAAFDTFSAMVSVMPVQVVTQNVEKLERLLLHMDSDSPELRKSALDAMLTAVYAMQQALNAPPELKEDSLNSKAALEKLKQMVSERHEKFGHLQEVNELQSKLS
ncbi:MAG: hypothetical protein EZS28_018554 [Streblomastix strix]|uniref:Dynein axonemal assembly factor 5 HEAT-repeat domain-containing protein n=1 Tax=Streblomastix strix TaxID=222440 RepID=A0A5J4VTI3_9EUKA|nr:MAG: hypothetical protein EZS28_018554 [Streblomastix strix]